MTVTYTGGIFLPLGLSFKGQKCRCDFALCPSLFPSPADTLLLPCESRKALVLTSDEAPCSFLFPTHPKLMLCLILWHQVMYEQGILLQL